MYKFVTMTAAAVIASTVSSFAQSTDIQFEQSPTGHCFYTDATGAHDAHPSNCGVIYRGIQGEAGEAGRDGRNGRDGVDGLNGRNGIDGLNGRDGQDANLDGLYEDLGETFANIQTDFEDARVQTQMGIAGASALSFANNGGSGLGIGIAAHQGFNAGAVSYSHDINNSFSASIGATTTGTVGAGVKWKF